MTNTPALELATRPSTPQRAILVGAGGNVYRLPADFQSVDANCHGCAPQSLGAFYTQPRSDWSKGS